jgi:hypothetical protein
MSIKTTYKCNLCHTEYERPTDLKAYYWGILPETKTVMGYQLVDKIDVLITLKQPYNVHPPNILPRTAVTGCDDTANAGSDNNQYQQKQYIRTTTEC